MFVAVMSPTYNPILAIANPSKSLFGMNVDAINSGPPWWWVVVLGALVFMLVILVWGLLKIFRVHIPHSVLDGID